MPGPSQTVALAPPWYDRKELLGRDWELGSEEVLSAGPKSWWGPIDGESFDSGGADAISNGEVFT